MELLGLASLISLGHGGRMGTWGRVDVADLSLQILKEHSIFLLQPLLLRPSVLSASTLMGTIHLAPSLLK